DDAGVLADRALALRAHARVGEDLRDRILRRRRLLGRVCRAERLDVIQRVVIRNVLQGVGDAVDEIALADYGHEATGKALTERTSLSPPPCATGRRREVRRAVVAPDQ